jgi:ADP-heptose:LPS heptosyltransferase
MGARLFRLLLRLYAWCSRIFPFEPPDGAEIRRVAIFSVLGPGLRTGDHVAASIVPNLVARRFPNATLHFVISKHQAQAFGNLYLRHTPIDQIIVCDLSNGGPRKNWLALWREVRARKFDVCVHDCRDTVLSPAFAHLCGIRFRIGLHRGESVDEFINPPRGVHLQPDLRTTMLDLAESYARALAFDPPLAREQIEPHFELAPMTKPLGVDAHRPIVAVHAGGARDWNRRWPDTHFISLCERLSRECRAQIVFLGGEEERAEAELIVGVVRKRCPDANIRNVCGGDLNWLSHQLANADLLVANDSAVMHIAAGLHKPAVIAFGPTTYFAWDAYRHQSNVSLNLECWRHRPTLGQDVTVDCGHQCPVVYDPAQNQYPYCMRQLTVARVFDECERRLAGSVAAAHPPEAARAGA